MRKNRRTLRSRRHSGPRPFCRCQTREACIHGGESGRQSDRQDPAGRDVEGPPLPGGEMHEAGPAPERRAAVRRDRHADEAVPHPGARGRRRHVRLHPAARRRGGGGDGQEVLPADRARHLLLPQTARRAQGPQAGERRLLREAGDGEAHRLRLQQQVLSRTEAGDLVRVSGLLRAGDPARGLVRCPQSW